MQPLSSQVEGMFSTNSRADMTEAITEVIMAACTGPHPIPERLIIEHAIMLAILHTNVATEVGEY